MWKEKMFKNDANCQTKKEMFKIQVILKIKQNMIPKSRSKKSDSCLFCFSINSLKSQPHLASKFHSYTHSLQAEPEKFPTNKLYKKFKFLK